MRVPCPAACLQRGAPLPPASGVASPNATLRSQPAVANRRWLLQAAAAALPSLLALRGGEAQAASGRTYVEVDPQALQEVQAYWRSLVQAVQSQLGRGFDAQLVVYGLRGAMVPSAAPGDPGKDFTSSGRGGDGHCGLYQGPAEPYALCPAPGEVPADELAVGCCRHYAYYVPYDRLGPSPGSVVVSPRLLRLPPARWRAILAHEMGHAIDFYLFGGRYGLRSKSSIVKAAQGEVAAVLAAADAEDDVEVRADILGEGLLLLGQGQQLCYDPALRLQLLVEGGTPCEGDGSGSQLMRHYTHPLIPPQR